MSDKNFKVGLNVKAVENVSQPLKRASNSISKLRDDAAKLSGLLSKSGSRSLKDFHASLEKIGKTGFRVQQLKAANDELNKYFEAARKIKNLKLEDRALQSRINIPGTSKEDRDRLIKERIALSKAQSMMRSSAKKSLDRMSGFGIDVSDMSRKRGMAPSEARAIKARIDSEMMAAQGNLINEEKRARATLNRHELEARAAIQAKRRRDEEDRQMKDRHHKEKLALTQKIADDRKAESSKREEIRRTEKEAKEAAKRVSNEEKRIARARRQDENHARQKEIAFNTRMSAYQDIAGGLARMGGSGRIQAGMSADRALSIVKAKLILPEVDPSSNPALFDQKSREIRDQAIGIAQKTGFSPTEIFSAYEELAKTGFKMKDVTEAVVTGVAQASQVSGMAIGDTVNLASGIIEGFGMDARTELVGVTNALASVADMTQLDMTDLGYTFKYVASQAKLLGVTFDQTATLTALMGKGGIRGEMAGTAIRTFFERLSDPTSEGRTALKKLNMTALDGNGNFKKPEDFLKELDDEMKARNYTPPERVAVMSDLFGRNAGSQMASLLDSRNRTISAPVKGQPGVYKQMNQWDYMMQEVMDSKSSNMIAKKADIITSDLQGSVDRLKASTDGFNLIVANEMAKSASSLVESTNDAAKALSDFARANPGLAKAYGLTTAGGSMLGSVASDVIGNVVTFIGLKKMLGLGAAGAGATAVTAGATTASTGAGLLALEGGLGGIALEGGLMGALTGLGAGGALMAALPWILGAAAVGGLGYGAYKLLSDDEDPNAEAQKRMQELQAQPSAMDRLTSANRPPITSNQTFNNVFNMYNSDKSNEEIAQSVIRKMEQSGKAQKPKLAALYDGGDSDA